MPTFSLNLTHARASDFKGKESDSPRLVLQKAASLLNGVAGGVYGATSLEISQDSASGGVALADVGGVAATGYIEFNSASGSGTATINGVSFPWTFDTDDATTAFALYESISESTNPAILGVVTVTVNGGDPSRLTVVADAKGAGGNAITLAVTGTGAARSNATLVNGQDGLVTITVNGTAEATTTTNLTDADAAALCASEINDNSTISTIVSAAASGSDVVLTAKAAGPAGNAIAYSATSATGTATPVDTTLTGGTSFTYSL